MEKYTKRPWKVIEEELSVDLELDNGGFRIDGPETEQIAYVWNGTRRYDIDNKPTGPQFGSLNGKQDAKLMSSAPEMYELLLKCNQHFWCLKHGYSTLSPEKLLIDFLDKLET